MEINLNKQLAYEFTVIEENRKNKKDAQALAELKEWLEVRIIETVKNQWDDQRIAYEFTINKIKELQGE